MKFKAFNLDQKLLNSLCELGYTDCTAVQEKVIPLALKRKNLFVQSETGSGKTHSFLIPLIARLNLSNPNLQAVIIAPTRELAKQTYDFLVAFNKFYPSLKVKLLIGGKDRSKDASIMNNAPHVLIGTPGRLGDILIKESLTKLSTIHTIILDEADMVMELGYFDDVHAILNSALNAQVMVFSATYPARLETDLRKYIEADKIIKIGESKTSENVTHFAIDRKHQTLEESTLAFIRNYKPYFLLIFCSTKEGCNKLYQYLINNNIRCGLIHGDLEPRERKNMMRRIKNEEFSIVVCSDMAARGIDLPNVSTILNYDVPNNIEFYFHRAGRTGRYLNKGECFTFYNVDDVNLITKLESLGVKFNWVVYKNGVFEDCDNKTKKKAKPLTQEKIELNKKIKIATSKVKTNKVKPNYKKRVRMAAEKVKRQHRREIIKKDIRRQREERYKAEAKNGRK